MLLWIRGGELRIGDVDIVHRTPMGLFDEFDDQPTSKPLIHTHESFA